MTHKWVKALSSKDIGGLNSITQFPANTARTHTDHLACLLVQLQVTGISSLQKSKDEGVPAAAAREAGI